MEMVGNRILEDVLGIEILLVDEIRSVVADTHHECFGRSEPGSLRLGHFDSIEELVQGPHQRICIS